TVENGTAMFNFNQKPYDIVSLSSGAIEIDGVVLEVSDTIELEGIRLKYVNRTDDDVIILRAFVIAGEDVKQVFRDAQHARISGAGDNWHFEFSITLSSEAAQRFAAVTSDLSKDFSNGRSYLSSNIDLYLDDDLVDSLRISSDLQGKIQPEIQISGPGDSRDDAWRNMNQLQSILESGALPTEIEIVQMNTISPTLGEEFMKSAVIAILFSILAVSVVIYFRYKDPRIVIPIILTSCTEVLLIFGFAAFIQWTIDLAAIAGIIAAIGSGVDDQIIITDESDKKKKDELSLKRKLKRAFFIIFASAATTIAVMVPLLTVGAGGVRGFAFTTIIGVVIGVLFTRPAFAKVIEYLRR
ncbi:MAG: MMPL family transporter, partial [Candidatus Aenigmarchaeota archaeon]|nr:MMPL family transporter [Candidatus Aenigmarchaeota archaeon]